MNKESKIPITEIFYSIEGEGINAGRPCVFVRVAGCNFAFEGTPCLYCDTRYSQRISKESRYLSTLEICSEISKFLYANHRAVITGGEPLVYTEQIKQLIEALYKCQYAIEIETNGSLPIFNLPRGCLWALDIKTPCSGNESKNLYNNLARLKNKDQVKFIIADQQDMDFAFATLTKYPTKAQIIFQPAWGKCNLNWLVESIKYQFPRARLSLQLHKIIWGEKKGV
jgi:7-carboxy-7-deazaguanine synthase